MKDRLKYVIDSRYFDGTCLTSMSDGFHNDYGGETIEELRIRENNPYLKAVTPSDIDKKLRLYHQSLSEPFKEITEEDYYDLLDVLPPLRMRTKLVLCGRTVLRKYVLFLLYPSRKIFQGPALRTYSAIRTGQSDRPSHGNHQPESRDLKRGNKQNGHNRNQTHSLLFFTGRKTVRIHLQPCHPIRFQTSKDGHGEYPEKSSPEPLSVL